MRTACSAHTDDYFPGCQVISSLEIIMNDLVAPNLVANFLLVESRERGEILTNLKLQKLLYYSQAWHLALYDTPLFQEEFQAWVHGPVLPSQYYRFNDFKWLPITTDVDAPTLPAPAATHLSEILDVFGVETAVALEHMTHDEMPWKRARGSLPPHEPSRAVIEKSWMKDFYLAMANEQDKEAHT